MGKWTLERWLTIGVFVFTLGANWGRVWSQQAEIDKINASWNALGDTYVRKDIYNLNQQHMIEAIDRLNMTLQKLLDLDEQTGEPPRVQGRRLFEQ